MATATADRQQIQQRLDDARARTDEIFALLEPEALYERPIPERHRLIFYLGHVEAFDWNLIPRGALGAPPFDADFDRLFAFGIDPVGGGLPNEPASQWPARERVLEYNARLRRALDDAVSGADLEKLDGGSRFEVAIEHRLMHAETLAYLVHQLPHTMKRRPAGAENSGDVSPAVIRHVGIPAGRATLGRSRARGFGWDNEFDELAVEVPAFAIDSHPVTNRGWLEFLDAGGYRERRFWSEADWAWRTGHGIEHPLLWARDGGGWHYRGMFDDVPLPLEHPVYVSHAEASAFAHWANRALPTEAQFHRAAYGTPQGVEREFPWGDEPPAPIRGNFDFARWDPVPVSAHPAGASAFGVHDLLGNGWEWTSTAFAPLPGFTPFPFYRGYSADFFDGKHFVIKGGSARTAACMLRRSFRNWFQPHYPYLYAKFRLVGA
jgi:ergothioneine biosynthesis protein EgtB